MDYDIPLGTNNQRASSPGNATWPRRHLRHQLPQRCKKTLAVFEDWAFNCSLPYSTDAHLSVVVELAPPPGGFLSETFNSIIFEKGV